jgi:hypothetical protein
MNSILDTIPQKELTEQAVTKLRQYFHEYKLSEQEADTPMQVGKTMVEVINDMKMDNPLQWRSEFNLIWGRIIRNLLRKWGYGENYLQIDNLNNYYDAFVDEALKNGD